jgi:hypothetical protein
VQLAFDKRKQPLERCLVALAPCQQKPGDFSWCYWNSWIVRGLGDLLKDWERQKDTMLKTADTTIAQTIDGRSLGASTGARLFWTAMRLVARILYS